ncbi:hypothetical protein EX30DRAFT_343071 [Ascodesmis nigricans]|uniref:Uncharacterized protein n=1 Tax=Ascodesmis nigricans TaxID=341454 RepID=A0A4S2MN21_9PEZI|nr:hypothetical protein EX30DRAFT_343071 [Ascodesmis nigricans]
MAKRGRDQRGSADMGRHRDHHHPSRHDHRDHRDTRDTPHSESREGVTYSPSHPHSRTSPHHPLPSTHRDRGIIRPREYYLRQKEEEEKRKREEKEARLKAEREVERRREEKVRIMKMALGRVDFL